MNPIPKAITSSNQEKLSDIITLVFSIIFLTSDSFSFSDICLYVLSVPIFLSILFLTASFLVFNSFTVIPIFYYSIYNFILSLCFSYCFCFISFSEGYLKYYNLLLVLYIHNLLILHEPRKLLILLLMLLP